MFIAVLTGGGADTQRKREAQVTSIGLEGGVFSFLFSLFILPAVPFSPPFFLL